MPDLLTVCIVQPLMTVCLPAAQQFRILYMEVSCQTCYWRRLSGYLIKPVLLGVAEFTNEDIHCK